MSNAANNGGPAFPVIQTVNDWDRNNEAAFPNTYSEGGMTLRDYFAAKAMQVHITAAWTSPAPSQHGFKEWKAQLPPDAGEPDFDDWIAYMAGSVADAMLAERGDA